MNPEKKLTETLNTQIKQVSQLYDDYRNSIRNGKLGKTATYWLTYLDLVQMQYVIHKSVQENDFEKRVLGWKYFLPFYFALNYSNYARYGSYYVQVLESIEQMYPGLKDMLKCKGLSVQAQEKYSLRTSIDQRGEQTINRDAKTSGGVKAFNTKEESVLKWCLNQSELAKNTKALEDLCGLGIGTGIYKPTRKRLHKKRLHTNEKLSHEPIKRNPKLGFKSLNKKTVLKNKKSVEANRDMLAKLLAICIKQERKIDFQKALTYPLAEVPLALCNADGSMRKTNKK